MTLLSSVPWWGWAGGAGAALVAMAAFRKPARVPVATAQIRRILGELFPAGSKIPLWYALTNAALESGFDETARLVQGRDDSYGLMQINLAVPSLRAQLEADGLRPDDLLEPETNARFWRDRIAGVFRSGAVRRGYSGDRLWEAVRLRCAGIGWDDFECPKAVAIKARLWRYAARFR